MTVYSFWIFDRHCTCTYSKDWQRERQERRPASISQSDQLAKQGGFTEFGRAKQGASNGASDDDAKLIFGVVFSLRNMTRKLTDEDSFVSYKTSKYRLHFYETPTNVRFVLMTDPKMDNQQVVLKQIYVSLYVEYIIKNPLHPVDTTSSPLLNNELFVLGLESFLSSLPGFE